MAFDYRKLKGRIIEKFGSQSEFAKQLGISENIMSKKMQNKTRFTSKDIHRISALLDLEPEDIGIYFFTTKV